MDIFELNEYKQVIRTLVDGYKQQFGQRITYEKLANACGVQKAYLSRVLNGPTHLSTDQIFQACAFLRLKGLETEYVLLLHAYDTSSLEARRKSIRKKIESLRAEAYKTDGFLAGDTDFSDSTGFEYFGNANLQLVYLSLTIPALRKAPDTIGRLLGLAEPELRQTLLKLQELRLVRFENGEYQATTFKRHLTTESPYIWSYHLTHRLKVCNRLQSMPDRSDYFFSAVFSADEETRRGIQRAMLDIVANAQKNISVAREEGLYQLNMDLLSWA